MSWKTDIAVLGAVAVGGYVLVTQLPGFLKGVSDAITGSITTTSTTTNTPYTGQAPTSSAPWTPQTPVTVNITNPNNPTITTGPQPGQNIPATTITQTTNPGLLGSLLGQTSGSNSVSVLPGGSLTYGGNIYTWTPSGLTVAPQAKQANAQATSDTNHAASSSMTPSIFPGSTNISPLTGLPVSQAPAPVYSPGPTVGVSLLPGATITLPNTTTATGLTIYGGSYSSSTSSSVNTSTGAVTTKPATQQAVSPTQNYYMNGPLRGQPAPSK